MKKIILVLTALLLMVAVAGCGARDGQDRNQEPAPGPGDQVVYPIPVTQWLERVQPMFLAGYLTVDGTTYVMVNWGEQPTAGHEVHIAQVKQKEDKVVVMVEFSYPGEAAAQVLTYPRAVEALDFDPAGKEIVFEDVNQREYIPRLIGIEDGELSPFLPRSTVNIKLLSYEKDTGRAKVTGIARAFEANINYALEEAEAQVLREGYSTAASAGPDWGYFEMQVEDIPTEAEHLVIYTVNYEDGSRWETIMLEL